MTVGTSFEKQEPQKAKTPAPSSGAGVLETRVVSRSTLSRTCEGANKDDDDDKNERGERDVDDSDIDASGSRDRSTPRRTACGGVVPELDAALRHDRREPRRFAQCQAPAY
jgi:hypothetical protein